MGHPAGEACMCPEPAPKDFTVIHTTGIFSISLDFCGCGASEERHMTQLLRHRLFPATVKVPQSAATFEALQFFELCSYVSKISAYDYYMTLERLSDNTGICQPKVCFHDEDILC